MGSSIVNLYRDYLRAIRRLPHAYLRQFYRIKAQDSVRSVAAQPMTHRLRAQRFKRVSNDIRKIKSATNGDSSDFANVLDIAYGRKGKLRWEIMEPLLNASATPPPPPIIPTVPKSKPPMYSAGLAALLTSKCSRTKPLSSRALITPPMLPDRANPQSEEARLLGPLSKRREINFRWRYFVTEWKKVKPPLLATDETSTQRDRVPKFGFDGLPIFEDIETIAGSGWIPRRLTRRERLFSADMQSAVSEEEQQPSSPRWLRRRYRDLLARIPKLGLVHKGRAITYEVTLSPLAMRRSEHFKIGCLPEADEADLPWLVQRDDGELIDRKATTSKNSTEI